MGHPADTKQLTRWEDSYSLDSRPLAKNLTSKGDCHGRQATSSVQTRKCRREGHWRVHTLLKDFHTRGSGMICFVAGQVLEGWGFAPCSLQRICYYTSHFPCTTQSQFNLVEKLVNRLSQAEAKERLCSPAAVGSGQARATGQLSPSAIT